MLAYHARTMSTTAAIAPVSAPERLQVVDLLRGWALLGILTVNSEFFSYPMSYFFLHHSWPNAGDSLFDTAMRIFAEGKFYTLFSTLFGWGFSVYLLKGERAGRSVIPLYLRRIFALMAIGAIHAYLIWMGDILLTYSLIAFPMLLFRKAKPKTLLIWASILILAPVMMMLSGGLARKFDAKAAVEIQRDSEKNTAEMNRMAESALRVYPSGSYMEVTRQRAWEVNSLYGFLPFFGPGLLAMFLVGLYIGRKRIFHDAAANLPFFRKVAVVSALIGIPGSLYYVFAARGVDMMGPSLPGAAVIFSSTVGHPALSYCYASLIVLLYHQSGWAARLHPVVCAGRMALTNYLMQSLICTFIFYSHGLGLYGTFPPRYLPLIIVSVYAIELAWSPWWLQRFHYGPAEWLWRSLTYAQMQPMRIRPAASASA